MEGKCCSVLRPFYTLLIPPADLYDPLIRIVVDPSDHETLNRFTVLHRYVGAYSIGLYVEKDFLYQTRSFDWGSRFEWRCMTARGLILSKELGATPSPFQGLRGNGFSLARYRVPNDLPQGESTTCEFKALAGGEDFRSRFGRAELYVAKLSDL